MGRPPPLDFPAFLDFTGLSPVVKTFFTPLCAGSPPADLGRPATAGSRGPASSCSGGREWSSQPQSPHPIDLQRNAHAIEELQLPIRHMGRLTAPGRREQDARTR